MSKAIFIVFSSIEKSEPVIQMTRTRVNNKTWQVPGQVFEMVDWYDWGY